MLARVSTGKQAEGFSLDTQEDRIVKYTEGKKDLVLDKKKFILTESGWKKERKGFTEMLDFIRTNHITNLLTLNEERLCRDFRSYVYLNDLIEEGLRIHFVETGTVLDGSDPDKMFIWQIKVAMAYKFIQDLKGKVKRGFSGKFEKGEYLTRPPLGYTTKKGKVELDKVRAPFIRQAFELYATGNYSLTSLRNELHNRGLRSRSDGRVVVPTLHSILRNDLFIGLLHRDGNVKIGVHAPLVDKALFEKVQAQLLANHHYYPMERHWYPYRGGLLRCGLCGCKYTAEPHKGHVYYRCSQAKARETGHRCPSLRFRQEQLEAAFTKALKGFQFDEELVVWAEAVITHALAQGSASSDSRREALGVESRKNKAALKRIIDDRAHGRFAVEVLEEKFSELQARQVEIQLELAEEEQRSGNQTQDILSMMDLLRNLSETFHRADDERKHKILRFVLEKVVVGEGGLKFHWAPTFKYFYAINSHKGKLGSKDSNLDCMIQSHESCRWTTSQQGPPS